MSLAARQKRQEEANLRKVRELLRLPENKKCFDCPTKSPFFVNTTIQTFICSRCSGLVREVGHRVKSISASTFSEPEILALEQGGNGVARSIWLSNYGQDNLEPETDADVRAFIRQKYYEQKWLDKDKLKNHVERVRKMIKETFTEEGVRRPGIRNPPLPKPLGSTEPPAVSQQEKPRPASLQLSKSAWQPAPPQSPSVKNIIVAPLSTPVKQSTKEVNLLLDDDDIVTPSTASKAVPAASPLPISSPPPQQTAHVTTLTKTAPVQQETTGRTSPKEDIFSELAGLQPTSKSYRRATYTGGILTPSTPNATSPVNFSFPAFTTSQSTDQHTSQNSAIPDANDPYAALRNLSLNSPTTATSRPTAPVPPSSNGPLKTALTPSTGPNHSREDSDEWTEFSASTTDANLDDSFFGEFAKNTSTPAKPDVFGDLDPLANIKRSSYRV